MKGLISLLLVLVSIVGIASDINVNATAIAASEASEVKDDPFYDPCHRYDNDELGCQKFKDDEGVGCQYCQKWNYGKLVGYSCLNENKNTHGMIYENCV